MEDTHSDAEGDLIDIASMSLEDLLNLEVYVTNVLGIHHMHRKAEWMIGYHYMLMGMDGNRDGTNRKSTSDVLQNYMVAPTQMTTEVQMFNIMYGFTDTWTLMAMFSYVRKSMDHTTSMGNKFTTNSEGFGDLKLMGTHAFWESEHHQFMYTPGVSVPTGSINEKDSTPSGFARLPYPMQIGSGTFDLLPELTYSGQRDDWYWGANTLGTIRLGRNARDYSLGDEFSLDAWVGNLVTEEISLTLQTKGRVWGNIDGSDAALNPTMVPTADPNLRGGERIDLLAGFNFFRRGGKLSGNRISIEAGLPVYQSLDGPQLESDWIFKIALQRMF